MMSQFKGLLASRNRISTQLYLAFGGAVLLTLSASLVGWFSFNRVGDVQSNVNEGSVPEMAAAFGVARNSGVLVSAAPNLTVAATPDEFAQIGAEIDSAYAAFEEQVRELELTDSDAARVARIGAHADTLITNIETLENETADVFALRAQLELLEDELAAVRFDLNTALAPALDNQLFFLLTGYRNLAEPQAGRDEYFSEEELVHYRRLSELLGDVNIATELLANAFTLSEPSLIEPLRERFEAATSRISRNIAPLDRTAFYYDYSAAIAIIAAARASMASGGSVSVGSIISASSTMSGK